MTLKLSITIVGSITKVKTPFGASLLVASFTIVIFVDVYSTGHCFVFFVTLLFTLPKFFVKLPQNYSLKEQTTCLGQLG